MFDGCQLFYLTTSGLSFLCFRVTYVLYLNTSNTFNKGKETVLDFTNTEGTITLNEGNVLRVKYTPIIMTKGGGLTFD